jgi:hypothetical protein
MKSVKWHIAVRRIVTALSHKRLQSFVARSPPQHVPLSSRMQQHNDPAALTPLVPPSGHALPARLSRAPFPPRFSRAPFPARPFPARLSRALSPACGLPHAAPSRRLPRAVFPHAVRSATASRLARAIPEDYLTSPVRGDRSARPRRPLRPSAATAPPRPRRPLRPSAATAPPRPRRPLRPSFHRQPVPASPWPGFVVLLSFRRLPWPVIPARPPWPSSVDKAWMSQPCRSSCMNGTFTPYDLVGAMPE